MTGILKLISVFRAYIGIAVAGWIIGFLFGLAIEYKYKVVPMKEQAAKQSGALEQGSKDAVEAVEKQEDLQDEISRKIATGLSAVINSDRAALERLRNRRTNLPEKHLPAVAENTGESVERISERIGDCWEVGGGYDPCAVGRKFFDGAVKDRRTITGWHDFEARHNFKREGEK